MALKLLGNTVMMNIFCNELHNRHCYCSFANYKPKYEVWGLAGCDIWVTLQSSTQHLENCAYDKFQTNWALHYTIITLLVSRSKPIPHGPSSVTRQKSLCCLTTFSYLYFIRQEMWDSLMEQLGQTVCYKSFTLNMGMYCTTISYLQLDF